MTYNVEVTERPSQRTLAIHTHSAMQNLPKVIPQAIDAVVQYMKQIGQQPSGAPFVAYYNMDMQNLDVEIGFPVSENAPGKGNIQPGSIPAGRMAACMHVGPYATLSAAHQTLQGWMHDKGYESAGAYYEIYLDDPADATSPDDLHTQVFTLLKAS